MKFRQRKWGDTVVLRRSAVGRRSPPKDETRDLIEGVDEDGNNVLLEVVRYFFYNGEEYVVLGEAMMANATVNASIVTTTRKRKPSISIS